MAVEASTPCKVILFNRVVACKRIGKLSKRRLRVGNVAAEMVQLVGVDSRTRGAAKELLYLEIIRTRRPRYWRSAETASTEAAKANVRVQPW